MGDIIPLMWLHGAIYGGQMHISTAKGIKEGVENEKVHSIATVTAYQTHPSRQDNPVCQKNLML